MGLFFDVLSAINNPNQEASVDQLGQVMNNINSVANDHGVEPSTMQKVMSALGPALQPALKEQIQGGNNPLENIMGSLTGGGNAGLGGLASLIPVELQEKIVAGVAQRTNLDSSVIQGMIPQLIPLVMNLFSLGKTTSGVGGPLNNPLLKSFLDSDRDGDVDLGDVFQFGNRFLNPPQ
jgi:hypothetical protein